MAISPLIVTIAAGGVVFAILRTVGAGRGWRGFSDNTGEAAKIVTDGLISVNIAGVLGLSWLAADMLYHDGLMVVEHGICAALIAFLVLTTWSAVALERRNKTYAAAALLALPALPTIATYGFLLHLESNPIDMR